MEQPRTVADVLERVRASWAGLNETIAGLSEDQLVQPGPEGWSVKDHLAHIAVWDSVPVAIIRGQRQHVAFGLDRAAYERIDSVDQLNAIVYERYRDKSLSEVRSFVSRAHSELVGTLQQLSDADLDRPLESFGAEQGDVRPLRDKIEGDSYGHYAEHSVWIRELLAAILSS